jgi:hypothetical protein
MPETCGIVIKTPLTNVFRTSPISSEIVINEMLCTFVGIETIDIQLGMRLRNESK